MEIKYCVALISLIGCCTLQAMDSDQLHQLQQPSPRVTFNMDHRFGVDIEQSDENNRGILVAAFIRDLKNNKRELIAGLDILKMPKTAEALAAFEQSLIESAQPEMANQLAAANARIHLLESQLQRLKEAQQ